jgi:hypothetical protein
VASGEQAERCCVCGDDLLHAAPYPLAQDARGVHDELLLDVLRRSVPKELVKWAAAVAQHLRVGLAVL